MERRAEFDEWSLLESDPGVDGGAPSIMATYNGQSIMLTYNPEEGEAIVAVIDEHGEQVWEMVNVLDFEDKLSRNHVRGVMAGLALTAGADSIDGLLSAVDQLAEWRGWWPTP